MLISQRLIVMYEFCWANTGLSRAHLEPPPGCRGKCDALGSVCFISRTHDQGCERDLGNILQWVINVDWLTVRFVNVHSDS